MIAVNCHVIEKEKAIGEPYGFEVTHHDMTLYGYCQSCQH
jgi:Fur family ferric uptake transcriptional regulator